MCADRRNAADGRQFEEAADDTHFGDCPWTDGDGIIENKWLEGRCGCWFKLWVARLGRPPWLTPVGDRQNPRISEIWYSSYPMIYELSVTDL